MVIKKTDTVEKQVEEKAPIEPISATLKGLLVDQLAHELRNHNLYQTFANFYAEKGLDLLSEYYRLRALEEYQHHEWIRWFLQENDISYKYPTVEAIDEEFKDLIDPIKLTVEVEEETTNMIYDIANQALEENEHITYSWLNGNDKEHGALIIEQLEEESLSNTVLQIAKMDDSWLIKEKAIMDLYKK